MDEHRSASYKEYLSVTREEYILEGLAELETKIPAAERALQVRWRGIDNYDKFLPGTPQYACEERAIEVDEIAVQELYLQRRKLKAILRHIVAQKSLEALTSPQE